MDALVYSFPDFDREREIRALLKESKEWGERFGHGYAEQWDDRAMRIIRSEQRRIDARLRELGWRK